jgi:putative peptide zinc metalloprotease protein
MLPAPRSELSLHPGPPDGGGAPSWTIRDPARNRYFRLSWPAFEILARWNRGNPEDIARAVSEETTLRAEPDDVVALAEFLVQNELVQPDAKTGAAQLAQRARARRQSPVKWLLHHYLFFRIPLLRPNHVLGALLPAVRWMGSTWFRLVTALALVLGLALAGREWDLFTATLVDTFSPAGFLSYALALILVKSVHEMAHGFTARHFGCQVPTMGVAFLVLWPVLYTDVNDAWMLRHRRQRLFVGAAGILSELTVAAWATLAWVFLPEGGLKQGAFVLGTVTWISSLIINLSPFMRFDGYFLAMDALEMPNLHSRSFAVARWWLRETLFGLGDPMPEPFPPGKRRALVAFAFATWIYRLLLFLGIAVLVYHFFIKTVGVLLFAVEIVWFVIAPIWSEARIWKARSVDIFRGRRVFLSLAGLALLVLLATVPWRGTVGAPAVLKAAQVTTLYLPFPARLDETRVADGDRVTAGQVLMTFSNPDLTLHKALLEVRKAGREAELDVALLDRDSQKRLGVLREALAETEAELAASTAEEARLTLVAPFDGVFRGPQPAPAAGEWLSPRDALGLVRTDGPPVATVYVAEDDLARLTPGAQARFTPSGIDRPELTGTITRIDPTRVDVLPDPLVAAPFGGPLPARESAEGLVPDGAVTRVDITLNGAPPDIQLLGSASLDAERASLAERFVRSVVVVLIREWGT